MGYYEDRLAQVKKQAEDQLAARPAQIEAQIQQERDLLAQNDQGNTRNVTDALTGISSKYGIDPTTIQAGQAQLQQRNPALQRQRETQLSSQRIKNMSDFFTQKYNYALSTYQDAGYNLAQSTAYAKAWARQQTDQQFQTDLTQKQQAYETQRNDIATQYSNLKSGISTDQSDPYEAAALRSITGLVPYVGYAAYLKNKAKNPTGLPVSTPQNTTQPINPAELNAFPGYG